MMAEESHESGRTTARRPLFRALDPDEGDELETTEIESLCMACGENGTTRLLLTRIPMFHDVIIMSFQCPHCHTSNNEIQPGTPIQEMGVRYTLTVNNTEDLNIMVVKASTALVNIPELDFEIPPNTQKGSITTVESIIAQCLTGLEQEQPVRRALHPELASKLDEFIMKLKECLEVKQSFTVVLDDPTGNSFIENKLAPSPNPHLIVENYERTDEQNRELGVVPSVDTEGEATSDQLSATATQPKDEEKRSLNTESDEIIVFQTNCSNCQSPTETRMKPVDIPHFKQVMIMATSCDHCGHRDNEVKSGTGISEYGTMINLRLVDPSDLSRDILKAETATIGIPELDFELQSGTLGGRFTTIEGILNNIKSQLKEINPFAVGDSASDSKLADFLDKLTEIIEGKRLGVHIVLDDPAGNSYIQNTYAPEPDPEMKVEHYQRTFEQNEELGLNDMRTENYV